MTIQVPYGKDFLGSLVLITTGSQDFQTTVTLADGDFDLRTDAQSLTALSAETAPFTSMSEEPRIGAEINGQTSGETAIYMGIRLASNTVAAGTATGEMFFRNVSGAFQSETLNITGGTTNFATIGADIVDIGMAEIGTTGEVIYAITAAELQTDEAFLLCIDASGAQWEDTAERIETYGHPLAKDPRGVRWADVIPQYGILDTTGVFTNTQTVVVGGKTYTTQTSLTNSDGNVDIGADARITIYNFVSAITLSERVTFTSGSVQPSIGNVLSNNSQTATLVAIGQLTSGSWSGGDAAGELFCTDASGIFASGDVTNDTTSASNVLTIDADFADGSGSGYAAAMTENTVVEAAPGTQDGAVGTPDQLVVYTKDGQSGVSLAVSETQTNASWMDAADAAITTMQSTIDTAGLFVDLPATSNFQSPTNDDDANGFFFEAEDESGTPIEGYIVDTDVANGSNVNGVELPYVRLTFAASPNNLRVNLANSFNISFGITAEREVPSRTLSKLSTVGLSTQEATDVSTQTLATAMTEAYSTDGNTKTVAQALYEIAALIGDFSITGTTLTSRQIDGSTTAGTYTLNDGSNPTSITRAT